MALSVTGAPGDLHPPACSTGLVTNNAVNLFTAMRLTAGTFAVLVLFDGSDSKVSHRFPFLAQKRKAVSGFPKTASHNIRRKASKKTGAKVVVRSMNEQSFR